METGKLLVKIIWKNGLGYEGNNFLFCFNLFCFLCLFVCFLLRLSFPFHFTFLVSLWRCIVTFILMFSVCKTLYLYHFDELEFNVIKNSIFLLEKKKSCYKKKKSPTLSICIVNIASERLLSKIFLLALS